MPESSIEAAVAAAEQDGLRFLLRVRLVVLAAVALWLITNYAPLRLALGLLTVAAFALSGVVQYQPPGPPPPPRPLGAAAQRARRPDRWLFEGSARAARPPRALERF